MVPTPKADNFSSVPGNHTGKGKNQRPLLSPDLCMYTVAYAHAHTQRHIDIYTHTHTDIYTQTHTYTNTDTHMCTCTPDSSGL